MSNRILVAFTILTVAAIGVRFFISTSNAVPISGSFPKEHVGNNGIKEVKKRKEVSDICKGSDPETLNDVFNALVRRGERTGYLTLKEVAENETNRPLYRNYAAQHLTLWLENHGDGYAWLSDVAISGDDCIRPIVLYNVCRIYRTEKIDHISIKPEQMLSDITNAVERGFADSECASVLEACCRAVKMLHLSRFKKELLRLMESSSSSLSVKVSALEAVSEIDLELGKDLVRQNLGRYSAMKKEHPLRVCAERILAR